MLISEIFLSIQGESTYVGMPCIFVRLAGCNLACSWCDTPYARSVENSREMTIEEILGEVKKFKPRLVEVTGGEPLIQAETKELLKRLVNEGYQTLIETNGSVSLEGVEARVVKIVDVKCPSSGHAGTFVMDNGKCLTPDDELKFVIADAEDYEYAKRFLEECVKDTTAKMLFAPVRPKLNPGDLADWILRDGLRVRLQIQLHNYIWEDGRR